MFVGMLQIVVQWIRRKVSVMIQEGRIALRKKKAIEGKIAIAPLEKKKTITGRMLIAIVGMMITIAGMGPASEGKIATEGMIHMLIEGLNLTVAPVVLKATTEGNLETDDMIMMPTGVGKIIAIAEAVEVIGIDGRKVMADLGMEHSTVERVIRTSMMKGGTILQDPSKSASYV